jgi:mono/diheme cytochrome c family protein
MAYADALRVSSEVKQLRNLMDYVAAKTTDLLALASTTTATTEADLQMPSAIGNKQYWLQLRNDSKEAWLEGGLGNTPVEETELRIYLPKEASATGHYVGGYGAACLKCHVSAGVLQIQLTSSSESD